MPIFWYFCRRPGDAHAAIFPIFNSQVVSCAEIVKRRYRVPGSLKQWTKISYRTVEEHWDPKTEDLEPIKVTREIPQIDTLLKKSYPTDCDNSEINVNISLEEFLNISMAKQTSSRRKKLKVNISLLNKCQVTSTNVGPQNISNTKTSHKEMFKTLVLTYSFFSQSKTGKRTGTSNSGKIDAARDLGLIDKVHGHGGNRKQNGISTSKGKSLSKTSPQDSNNPVNTKDALTL